MAAPCAPHLPGRPAPHQRGRGSEAAAVGVHRSGMVLLVVMGLILLAAGTDATVTCGRGKYGQERYLHVYLRSENEGQDKDGVNRDPAPWHDDQIVGKNGEKKGQAWLCIKGDTTATNDANKWCASPGYPTGNTKGDDPSSTPSAPWRRGGSGKGSYKVRVQLVRVVESGVGVGAGVAGGVCV